jgi:hypothetical protein
MRSVSIPSLDLSLQENSAMNVLRVVMDVAGSFSAGSSDDKGSYTENQLRSWLPLETPYIDLEPLYAVSHNVQRIYVENLSINPVAVRISLHLDSKPLELKGVKGGLMALPLIIVNMLKGMAGNIDRAPISLNRLVFKNLLTSRDRLVGRLIKHYTVQAAKESYKIVGSFELLGNPVGLISNVTEGLQEFVYAPIRGAKNSPKAFAVGLVKGTGALVKGSIYGAFSSVVSLSAAVGKGVAMLSLDDKFEQERLASAARHQNDHLGAALAHGFTAVGRGVISGVTELFMAPVRGAQEEGFTGLLKVKATQYKFHTVFGLRPRAGHRQGCAWRCLQARGGPHRARIVNRFRRAEHEQLALRCLRLSSHSPSAPVLEWRHASLQVPPAPPNTFPTMQQFA